MYGDSPLDIARYNANAKIVELLLAHGAKGKDGPSNKELQDRAYIDGKADAHKVLTLVGADPYF